MGARKGAARVGAWLVPLENNQSVGPFSPSCGEGGGFFHIEGLFSFFLGAIFSMRGGGGGLFLIMCRIFWAPMLWLLE